LIKTIFHYWGNVDGLEKSGQALASLAAPILMPLSLGICLIGVKSNNCVHLGSTLCRKVARVLRR